MVRSGLVIGHSLRFAVSWIITERVLGTITCIMHCVCLLWDVLDVSSYALWDCGITCGIMGVHYGISFELWDVLIMHCTCIHVLGAHSTIQLHKTHKFHTSLDSRLAAVKPHYRLALAIILLVICPTSDCNIMPCICLPHLADISMLGTIIACTMTAAFCNIHVAHSQV